MCIAACSYKPRSYRNWPKSRRALARRSPQCKRSCATLHARGAGPQELPSRLVETRPDPFGPPARTRQPELLDAIRIEPAHEQLVSALDVVVARTFGDSQDGMIVLVRDALDLVLDLAREGFCGGVRHDPMCWKIRARRN